MDITIDNYLPEFFTLLMVVFLISVVFLYFRQPVVIAYILAGILLGPHMLGVVDDIKIVKLLGSIGVVLLLFFLGIEIPLDKFAKNWRLFFFGTIFQVVGSLLVVALLGYVLHWSAARIVLLGFVISLSSTSLVINFLNSNKEIDTPIGTAVSGILLTQDLIIVPMMIIISLFDHKLSVDYVLLGKQVTGALAIVALIIYLINCKKFNLPFGRYLKNNEDLQLFFAFLLCLGLGTITYALGLSTAMGAFLAGLVVNAARETHWVKEKTEPFRIMFMALFFVSVGIIMDMHFIMANAGTLTLLTLITLLTNTVLNGFILYVWKKPIDECLYGGALLAQIGEFSFILAAIGFEAAIIGNFSYQMTLSLISVTLFVSPFWIKFVRALPYIVSLCGKNAKAEGSTREN